jgi:cbb3-type cytochrome oxidase cytochrome c subunit
VNNGPFLFLGSFVAMLLSWLGLIVAPQVQLRDLEPEKNETTGQYYPVQRLGMARQGADVYRANACYSCHSQQVRQTDYEFRAVVEKPGTNEVGLGQVLMKIDPEWPEGLAVDPGYELEIGKINLHRRDTLEQYFDSANLKQFGAKIRFDFRPLGPDIQRGWGVRASVARDYLYDDVVMPGDQRVGPDLANVGARLPDRNWHLVHLYQPQANVPGSSMPSYQFLFEKRRVGDHPSPNALKLEGALAPGAGWEIVPRPEALRLVAYLQSLKQTEPLYEAPAPMVEAPAPAATTK